MTTLDPDYYLRRYRKINRPRAARFGDPGYQARRDAPRATEKRNELVMMRSEILRNRVTIRAGFSIFDVDRRRFVRFVGESLTINLARAAYAEPMLEDLKNFLAGWKPRAEDRVDGQKKV